MNRTIGIIGAFWIVFAPLTAFWLMWEFAFKTKAHYYAGNTLIVLVLIGPPAMMALIYFGGRRRQGND